MLGAAGFEIVAFASATEFFGRSGHGENFLRGFRLAGAGSGRTRGATGAACQDASSLDGIYHRARRRAR